MRYLSMILLVFLSCGLNPNSNVVSTGSQTSSCGGFSGLAKKAMNPYVHDSLEYCKSEKLMWSYSSADKKLGFLHLRIIENCAAQVEMYIETKNGKFEILQKDNSDQRIRALCDCMYDTYCAVPNVQQESIIIICEDHIDTLHLVEGSGVVVIDTTSLCGRYPFN